MSSQLIQLDEFTQMHCWVPRAKSPDKHTLVLIPGYGGNAMWQWPQQIRPLFLHFNLYIPDIVFFGKSYSTGSERSEFFQAQSIMKLMKHLGVNRFHVGGISYGGFVAYRLAHLYPEKVQKVIIISAGVCMMPHDFQTNDWRTVAEIFLPQNPDNLRALMKISMHRPPWMIPTVILQDSINTMYTDQRKQRTELLQQLVLGKEGAPPLPVLIQETLIIWGQHDRVFPLDLGHRLKRHLGDRAELIVLKDTGHAAQLENPYELNKAIKMFLLESSQ